MGGHYGSVQLRTTDRAAVLAAAEGVARAMSIKCLVGPALNGWVGVYPEGNGQDHTVGERIAAAVGGHALHLLVHDDDVLAYWLWSDGELVDRYWSAPGYFGEENRAEEEPLVGDAARFAFVLGEAGQRRLRQLLERDDAPIMEYERLQKFGRVLGVRNAVAAYEYLKEGDSFRVTGRRQFVEVPVEALVAEKKQRSNATALLRAERKRLMAAGLLLTTSERDQELPQTSAADDGFVVVWPNYMGVKSAVVERRRPPWSAAESATFDLPPQPHVTGVHAVGERLAMTFGKGVRVWDCAGGEWRHLVDVPERDLALNVALSRDGRMLAHSSRSEVAVTDLASGQRVATVNGFANVQSLAFSPDGTQLAVANQALVLIDLASPDAKRRTLYVGGTAPDHSAIMSLAVRQQLGSADLSTMLEQQRAMAEKMWPKAEAGYRKMGMSDAEVAKAKEQIETQMKAIVGHFVAARDGTLPAQPPRGVETAVRVGFSADGRWLWCGSDVGLRVYDRAALPACDGPLTRSTWQFDAATAGTPGYVHAVAAEPGGGAVVFGSASGRIHRMDLSTGDVRALFTLPGGAVAYGLAVSNDGTTLAVIAQRQPPGSDRRRRHTVGVWEAWDYRRLLVGA